MAIPFDSSEIPIPGGDAFLPILAGDGHKRSLEFGENGDHW